MTPVARQGGRRRGAAAARGVVVDGRDDDHRPSPPPGGGGPSSSPPPPPPDATKNRRRWRWCPPPPFSKRKASLAVVVVAAAAAAAALLVSLLVVAPPPASSVRRRSPSVDVVVTAAVAGARDRRSSSSVAPSRAEEEAADGGGGGGDGDGGAWRLAGDGDGEGVDVGGGGRGAGGRGVDDEEEEEGRRRSDRRSGNDHDDDDKCLSVASPTAPTNADADVVVRGRIRLEDGTTLEGRSFGCRRNVEGEVVFSTGMVGYPESLSDPSYRGQILALTTPMVGNYGVPSRTIVDDLGLPAHFESYEIHVVALIVQDYSRKYSHWNAASSLADWLAEEGRRCRCVPALSGIDTRMLAKVIREKGAMAGKIEIDDSPDDDGGGDDDDDGDDGDADSVSKDNDGGGAPETTSLLRAAAAAQSSPRRSSAVPRKGNPRLVEQVSAKETKVYGEGNEVKVLAVDLGMKYSIIRRLVERDAKVTVVPWNRPFASDLLLDEYDGLVLSNGPGDPNDLPEVVEELRKVFDRAKEAGGIDGDGGDDDGTTPATKPIFGICLGHQLMGLAANGTVSKMPFGNRGHNQPVRNVRTGETYVTPQNHGYRVEDDGALDDAGWDVLFANANDGSVEGIAHATMPYVGVQFHPEANGGPTDASFLFDAFLDACRRRRNKDESESSSAAAVDPFSPRKERTTAAAAAPPPPPVPPPPRPKVKKVLLLGSGGTSIGQAGEFDYSGAQAIKALKEEGLEVILINPNIASVQTNAFPEKSSSGGGGGKADHVYFLPVTPHFVERVIRKHEPDGIVVSMGGQTALNCAVHLYRSKVFEKHKVQVLGTPISVVIDTEDRKLFSDRLNEIGEKIAKSIAARSVDDAVRAARTVGFPLIIRSAFALGGLGSGFCRDEATLREMAERALSLSSQILVEKSMKGWKEVEYEVVRDARDNCVTVCNMENFDPLGIHTGDSVVIAPSQTLSDEEYHMLRESAIKVVRHLGIIGECNIQFALHPKSLEYAVIEVNARLSRSSALASKATGYPLAFVAAKLALGIPMTEVRNAVTKKTQAAFEPSLDYVVTKIPRWDVSKFRGEASSKIGSGMKSVGEVMAIGRTLEESMQKALRMVDPSVEGFEPPATKFDDDDLREELANPTDRRIFAIAQALCEKALSAEEIHDITKIDLWFLYRLEAIATTRERLGAATLETMSDELLGDAKKNGFSDAQISKHLDGECTEGAVRAKRVAAGVVPFTKQIDTLAAEYPADTNYLYMTYHARENDVEPAGGGTIVLGSGVYRIGSSVEFDWSAVSYIRALRDAGRKSTMINYNPETVSTDYDECDRLYFEELSLERVLDIYERDKSDGVVVSVGGQIPNGLAVPLDGAGVKILGTAASKIDTAEDRRKFSDMIDEIGVRQPLWRELSTVDSALNFVKEVGGYPVLVRPSYVLSGAAMNVAWSDEQLEVYLTRAAEVSNEHPVVISEFIEGAVEIEMDGVGKDGRLIAAAVHEHIENAGVHSGDATLVLPPQDLSAHQKRLVRDISIKIVKSLNITGPVNIQFVAKGTEVMVIECNVRASRSFPFVSKTMGVDFIEAAARAMVGEDTSGMNLPALDSEDRPGKYVGVKSPMFSFTRLPGSDPLLGVEMASTGEVACFGATREEAFLKALLSTGFKMPKKNILLSVQADIERNLTYPANQMVQLGYALFATEATGLALQKNGINCTIVGYPTDKVEGSDKANAVDMLRSNKIDLVINIPTHKSTRLEDNYLLRRAAVDFGVPLFTNLQLVKLFSDAAYKYRKGGIDLDAKALLEYYRQEKMHGS